MLGVKISLVQTGKGTVFTLTIPETAGAPEDVFSRDGNEFLFEGGTSF